MSNSNRVGRHAKARQLLMLEATIGVEHVVGKHSALVRKSRSLFRHSSAISSDEHTCWIFFAWAGGRSYMFLVDRITGVDLILHSVQSRHQHRRKSEIGIVVASGKRTSTRRALGLVTRGMRQAAERLRDE